MSLTVEDIRKAAQAAVAALEAANFTSCLVGSAAGSEHGITRVPNDVDILVLTDVVSPSDLKGLLVLRNRDFFLARPINNPQATYLVLWYTLSENLSTGPAKTCRVDIFVPGMIHLPAVPSDHIPHSRRGGLPVMPVLPTLLHKVQAWIAHGESQKQIARDKQVNDISDIEELLELAVTVYDTNLAKDAWLPAWFVNEAVEGVRRYVKVYPATAIRWAQIGFEVL